MRLPICLAVLVCVSAAGQVASAAVPATTGGHAAKAACEAQALDSADYARSLNAVRRLPELAVWSRSHAFPVAFGESIDRQVLVDGRCYWSVSVYANRPERLELWNVFYVEVKGKRLLVRDPDSGEVVSLKSWRATSVKS